MWKRCVTIESNPICIDYLLFSIYQGSSENMKNRSLVKLPLIMNRPTRSAFCHCIPDFAVVFLNQFFGLLRWKLFLHFAEKCLKIPCRISQCSVMKSWSNPFSLFRCKYLFPFFILYRFQNRWQNQMEAFYWHANCRCSPKTGFTAACQFNYYFFQRHANL
jgi:hypothetical protein